MRYPINIGMTILALVATMRTGLEQFVVNVKQSEFAVFVNPAQSPVLMANKAIEFLSSLDISDRAIDYIKTMSKWMTGKEASESGN